jgi:hypothetical protein
MKCPFRFKIDQVHRRQTLFADDDIACGENYLFTEMQEFMDCYENECMAYDKKQKKCKGELKKND